MWKFSIVYHWGGKITGSKCDPKWSHVNCKNQGEKRL